MSLIKDTSNI